MSTDVVKIVCDRGEWHIKSRRNGHGGRRPWILARFVRDEAATLVPGWRPLAPPEPKSPETPGQRAKRLADMPRAGTGPFGVQTVEDRFLDLDISFDQLLEIAETEGLVQSIELPACPCMWPTPDAVSVEGLAAALDRAAREYTALGDDAPREGASVNVHDLPAAHRAFWSWRQEVPDQEWERYVREKAMYPNSSMAVNEPSTRDGVNVRGLGNELFENGVIVMCDGGNSPAWHRTHGARAVVIVAFHESANSLELDNFEAEWSGILPEGDEREDGFTPAVIRQCECGRQFNIPGLTEEEALDAAELIYRAGLRVVSVEDYLAVLNHR
ncbi:hypothetical protein [Actinomyces qiguomingii]|uniref:hypothetical protein n=1 Tax=Actinomyces qiguomingii TaxID=2057800 RepID=UPI000CA07F8A|nr:hypothetical protein [Actinomyces qiguomingii]